MAMSISKVSPWEVRILQQIPIEVVRIVTLSVGGDASQHLEDGQSVWSGTRRLRCGSPGVKEAAANVPQLRFPLHLMIAVSDGGDRMRAPRLLKGFPPSRSPNGAQVHWTICHLSSAIQVGVRVASPCRRID